MLKTETNEEIKYFISNGYLHMIIIYAVPCESVLRVCAGKWERERENALLKKCSLWVANSSAASCCSSGRETRRVARHQRPTGLTWMAGGRGYDRSRPIERVVGREPAKKVSVSVGRDDGRRFDVNTTPLFSGGARTRHRLIGPPALSNHAPVMSCAATKTRHRWWCIGTDIFCKWERASDGDAAIYDMPYGEENEWRIIVCYPTNRWRSKCIARVGISPIDRAARIVTQSREL